MAETAPDARRILEPWRCDDCRRADDKVVYFVDACAALCGECLARGLALLSAPQETPNVCERCGYVGPLVEHPGCNYQAGHLNPWPAPAALDPAVREAAEKVKRYYPLNDPDEPLTPFGEDVKALLSALDSNGGV